jgi:hypothetical protein
VQSGDKPAAAHFVFFIKPELRSQAIETIKQPIKTQRNSCNMRAIPTPPRQPENSGLITGRYGEFNFPVAGPSSQERLG